MRFLSVKNFEKFQHYKERRPPWIKLYQEVLEDYEFTRLQDASKAHLIAIWLLASRTENRVPFDAEWIAKTIHATTPVDIGALVTAGFLTVSDDASEALADRGQSASPETEREIETEGVVAAPTEYARTVTAAANRAAVQKWNAEPFPQGVTQSFTLAEECLGAGVPLAAAVQRVVDQIAGCNLPRPPRTIRYFLPGILEPNTPKRRGGTGQRSHDNVFDAIRDLPEAS